MAMLSRIALNGKHIENPSQCDNRAPQTKRYRLVDPTSGCEIPFYSPSITNNIPHHTQEADQNGCFLVTPSPAIAGITINHNHSTHLETPRDLSHAYRRQDTKALAIPHPPSTTASNEQTWLPPPSAQSGPTPQPVFTQDFELLPPTPTQASRLRTASLASTQPRSSNFTGHSAFAIPHTAVNYHNQAYYDQRNSTRPPVPLFHSNSTGNIPALQQNIDLTAINMGGAANVAYHDTMEDLAAFENGASFGDFNMFTDLTALSAGAGAGNGGSTVSPKDLFNGDSVPPSTSFTNLTTPGSTYLETPDSYNASPLFSDNLEGSFDFSNGNGNTNFFPDLDTFAMAPPMERTTSSSSAANQIVVHPGGPSHNRKRSSVTASPAPFAVRPSSVAGVGARKRDKPLPPIMVDESDAVALKRARNTAAARKSRAKKVEERDGLESRIADLEAALAAKTEEVEYWKTRAEGLVEKDLSD